MPAINPLPPKEIRALVETNGYKLIDEDAHNWAFTRDDNDAPIIVPRAVDLVPLEIAFHVAQKVGFNEYIQQLRKSSSSELDR